MSMRKEVVTKALTNREVLRRLQVVCASVQETAKIVSLLVAIDTHLRAHDATNKWNNLTPS